MDYTGMTCDEMEAFAPPPEEPKTLEEAWPVDGYGLKIPVNEWTTSDLGLFPDALKPKLIGLLLKHQCYPAVKLLKTWEPSQIAQTPEAANAALGEIISEMGLHPQPAEE